ncbi:MAG: GNAT family N-acetyltransferase [bacterium]|nr:GNAT family N-acetyltransferase [bacterium]
MDGPKPHDVEKVGRQDARRAGEVLGRAFYDTEQWALLLPDENGRGRQLRRMFSGTVSLARAAGGLVERTSEAEAVAVWLPPGRNIGLWPMVKSGFSSAWFLVTPPFPDLRRMMSTLRQFDDTHKQHMPEPHWYLMVLGVDPVHQGGGHGSLLVSAGIERADRDNTPIYLETEKGPNTKFYEKLGFDVLDEVTIEAIDLPFSLMVRQPE